MNLENRRHFSRILFDTKASLLIGQQNIPVSLIDISLRGALIQPTANLLCKPGTACTLNILLDGDEIAIRMEANISHLEDDHIGLICREIDLDSMIHLRRLVELNLGDESILNRELSALTSHE